MIEQEFIMLIMNCKKYRSKAIYQKNTWLKLLPAYIKYYHVIGDNNLDCEYKFDNNDNILLVKTMDDYNSLPNKVITSYKAVNETFNFKYLFKTDDDQILCNDKFLNMLCRIIKTKEPSPHYGGYIVNVDRPYLSKYYILHPELPKYLPLFVTKYCSGRFYFLSYDAIEYLLTKKNDINKEYLEDYAIGYNLPNVYKIGILNIDTNKYFKG